MNNKMPVFDWHFSFCEMGKIFRKKVLIALIKVSRLLLAGMPASSPIDGFMACRTSLISVI